MLFLVLLTIAALLLAYYSLSQVLKLRSELRELRDYTETLHGWVRHEWLTRTKSSPTPEGAIPDAPDVPKLQPTEPAHSADTDTEAKPDSEYLQTLSLPESATHQQDVPEVPSTADEGEPVEVTPAALQSSDTNDRKEELQNADAASAVATGQDDLQHASKARKRDLLRGVVHPEQNAELSKPQRRGWEEQFGVRLPIWIGAIAFFLAGAFLVKYTFDKGLLSPPVRVGMGIAFGLILIGVGEWMRSRDRRIAQGLTAAGVADLFASFLAAGNLYHLVSPTGSFVLLAATTGAAIFLSLRHGPFVALLGLIGGFITPALIGSEEPDASRLFGYLILLQVGLLAVTRKQRWLPLGALTMLGGFIWVVLWLTTSFVPADSTTLVIFLVASIGTFVGANYVSGQSDRADAWLNSPWGRPMSLLGVAVGIALLCVVIGKGEHTPRDWAFFGLLGAGTIALGRFNRVYEPFAFIAAVASLLLMIVWGRDLQPVDVATLRMTALGIGAVYAIGGYLAHRKAARPVIWTALSAGAAIAFFVTAYWFTEKYSEISVRWIYQALALAALFAAAAIPLYRNRADNHINAALGALCVAATFFLSLALPMEIDRRWLGVSWSLEAAALMFLAGWLGLPILRTLAATVAVVGAAMLLQPGVLTYEFGTHPLFNWILAAYGISAIAFVVAAWLAARQNEPKTSDSFQIGAILLITAGVGLMIRHAFHPNNIRELFLPAMEVTSYFVAALGLGIAAAIVARRGALRVPALGSRLFLLIGACACVLAMLTFYNPMLRDIEIGTTLIFNRLLFYLALPAALAAIGVFVYPSAAPAKERDLLVICVCILSAFFVGMEVRHAFHPTAIRANVATNIEAATYLCVGMILAGLWLAVRAARFVDASRRFATVLLVAVTIATVFVLGLIKNPLFVHESVGAAKILNRLPYLYGVPAILMLLVARWHREKLAANLSTFIQVVVLLLTFGLVSLEVRQWFQGEFLDGPRPGNMEMYSYSAAWILLGAALLAAGIWTRGMVLRWASLVVMLVTVFKVFLLDTSQLRDLYRVLSLFGLGVSLMVIAFVYQKFVFQRTKTPE